MIESERAGRVWKFEPLPVSRATGTLFVSLARISKAGEGQIDFEALSQLIAILPECIERSMRAHHTEAEINAFIDTIVLDMSNPKSMEILGTLSQLFLGITPAVAAA